MAEKKEVKFREVQRFTQIWLWLVLLISTIPGFVFLGREFIVKGPKPNLILITVLTVVGLLAFFVFFYSLKLFVEVREDGIYYKFFPFHLSFRKIPYEEIKVCEKKKFRPLRDHGGHGLRKRKDGWAYTVLGPEGILVKNEEGEVIILGSQKVSDFYEALPDKIKGDGEEEGQ